MRMDDSSIPSNSNPQPPDNQSLFQFKPFERPIANRIVRAFHRLRLLHRSDPNFFVLGASGNVYTVSLSTTPFCTCPDRIIPCKHILFVYLRVLNVSLDDTCLNQATLMPCQVSNLLVSPTCPESFAGVRVRERYHQLMAQATSTGVLSRDADVEEGARCPICLEEMKKEARLVACGSCRNSVHEDCLKKWKRTTRRSINGFTCVICRERWRDNGEEERYLNLAAYVSDDEDLDP